MSDLPSHLQAVVDAVCERGCEATNEIIAELEAGKTPREMGAINSQESRLILKELKGIMQVYQPD